MNDIYCDCIENGIVTSCPKLTINNFIYAFMVSIGGDNRELQAFNISSGDVEINGGFINYTGDGNTFTLSNKFITIKNVEDRAGVCNFDYTGEDGTVLHIKYEDGCQHVVMDIAREIAMHLNYICVFKGLWIPTRNYSGYAKVIETVDNVDYTLNIPVVFRFVSGSSGMYIYLYHDRAFDNAHLDTVL